MHVTNRFQRHVTAVIIFLTIVSIAQAKYGGGSGTAEDPYQIATAADLIALGNSPEDYDKHFILTADIDLEGHVFDKAVIASDTNPSTQWDFEGTPFTGVFDGNGHTISNLMIKAGGGVFTPVGLFGYVRGFSAEVRNLRLFKPDVQSGGMTSAGSLVGGLDDGTISNCYVQDCNVSGSNATGGLVCGNSGTIKDCHVSGQIAGWGHCVGGLAVSNGDAGIITRCSFSGSIRAPRGGGRTAGGLVGVNYGGISFCYSTGSVLGGPAGGLVGENYRVVYSCYSTSDVQGDAGGLVGGNSGIISNCYSTGTVAGTTYPWASAGGLVGKNSGSVTGCFWDIQTSGQATSGGGTGKTTAEMKMAKTFLDAGWDFVGGTVNGTDDIWWILEGKDYPRLSWQGLVFWAYPWNGEGEVSRSPILRWTPAGAGFHHDIYFGNDEAAVADATSQTQGIYRGRQSPEMATYDPGVLEWGKTYYWRIDEVNEADPNTPWKGDVWRFTTTDCIRSPQPLYGTTEVILSPILRWVPGGPGLQYDVYFGGHEQAVANATPQTPGIYRGRQPPKMTTYEPGRLKFTTTYYWRIDGVEEADPNTRWKGKVWSFTTADYIITSVLDDFESYTDDIGGRIFQTWLDGWGWDKPEPNYPGNGTGSMVGNPNPPFAEQRIVHGGKQSMPMDYNNVTKPWYSETQRTWETPQDWTTNHADTLTLYFQGKADNTPDSLYAAIEDSAGQIAVVVHPDANAVLTTEWQKWHIALAGVQVAGVDVAAVKKMCIGVGDRNNPQPGGTGLIYVDDIWLTRRTAGECFPSEYSTYNDWVALGKPDCWCAKPKGSGYQCDGDADGADSGGVTKYRVFTGDLDLIVKNWKKKAGNPTLDPCADIDHKDSGSLTKYRVFTGDLSVLVANWKKTDADLPGNCPRPE